MRYPIQRPDAARRELERAAEAVATTRARLQEVRAELERADRSYNVALERRRRAIETADRVELARGETAQILGLTRPHVRRIALGERS